MQVHPLFKCVEEYADIGFHRTGTSEDHTTLNWFCDKVRLSGGVARIDTFDFSQFVADWNVELNGRPVVSLPLYYTGCGRVNISNLSVARIDLSDADEHMAWGQLRLHIDAARQHGAEGLLVVTKSATGDVYAMNTNPDSCSDLPVFFVGDHDAEEYGLEAVRITSNARIVDGRSGNIVARFGCASSAPLLTIATPLSGWFNCAGERGAGIAIALTLAERLAARIPVEIVATSGHELGHLGARQHLKNCVSDPFQRIIHIGSCVGAGNGRPGWPSRSSTDNLTAIVHCESDRISRLIDTLSPIVVETRIPSHPELPASWQGESEEWSLRNRCMLSLAGTAPTFHTPSDIAAIAIEPVSLSMTVDCVEQAVFQLLNL